MVRIIKKSVINLIIAIYITILTYFFMYMLSGFASAPTITTTTLYNWLFIVMSVVFLHLVAYVIILIVKVVSDLKIEKVKASME